MNDLGQQLISGINNTALATSQSNRNIQIRSDLNYKMNFAALVKKQQNISLTMDLGYKSMAETLQSSFNNLGRIINNSLEIGQKMSQTASKTQEDLVENTFSTLFSVLRETSNGLSHSISSGTRNIYNNIDKSLSRSFNLTDLVSAIQTNMRLLSTGNKDQIEKLANSLTTSTDSFRVSYEKYAANLIQTMKIGITESMNATVESRKDIFMQQTMITKDNLDYVLSNILNMTLVQSKQHEMSSANLSNTIENFRQTTKTLSTQQQTALENYSNSLYSSFRDHYNGLTPIILQGLLNVSKRMDSSLSNNFNALNSILEDGTIKIVNGIDSFSNQSQKQLDTSEIMLRYSDQTLSHALSDISKTLEEKLSAIVSYKPVFDLSHGITRDAREKSNSKERNVSTAQYESNIEYSN